MKKKISLYITGSFIALCCFHLNAKADDSACALPIIWGADFK